MVEVREIYNNKEKLRLQRNIKLSPKLSDVLDEKTPFGSLWEKQIKC